MRRRATCEIRRTKRVRSNTPDFPAEPRASWTSLVHMSGALVASLGPKQSRIRVIAAGGWVAPSCRKSNSISTEWARNRWSCAVVHGLPLISSRSAATSSLTALTGRPAFRSGAKRASK
jgi:hypothetical protein